MLPAINGEIAEAEYFGNMNQTALTTDSVSAIDNETTHVQGMARMQGATTSAEIEQAGLSPPDDAGEGCHLIVPPGVTYEHTSSYLFFLS